jgi:hypothetical protein
LLFPLDQIDFTLTSLSIYAYEIREISEIFIYYSSSGTFTIHDCALHIAEQFSEYVSEKNTWNATFVSLEKGNYVFSDSEFESIIVKGASSVIEGDLSEGKTWVIKDCNFSIGWFGNKESVSEGNVILVTSASNGDGDDTADVFSFTVENCEFNSCFGYDGGVFRCDFYLFIYVFNYIFLYFCMFIYIFIYLYIYLFVYVLHNSSIPSFPSHSFPLALHAFILSDSKTNMR